MLTPSAVNNGNHGTATLAGDGRSVTYSPAADFAGSDTITYTVTDEHGGIATGTVNVTVTPVNDMPSFARGANPEHIDSASGPQTFPAWATAISDGDPEVEQALAFQVNVVSGASIFAAAPALSANGTLTYSLNGTPGIATVEVRLTDDATAGGDALTTLWGAT